MKKKDKRIKEKKSYIKEYKPFETEDLQKLKENLNEDKRKNK